MARNSSGAPISADEGGEEGNQSKGGETGPSFFSHVFLLCRDFKSEVGVCDDCAKKRSRRMPSLAMHLSGRHHDGGCWSDSIEKQRRQTNARDFPTVGVGGEGFNFVSSIRSGKEEANCKKRVGENRKMEKASSPLLNSLR